MQCGNNPNPVLSHAAFGQIARDDFKCGIEVQEYCGEVPRYFHQKNLDTISSSFQTCLFFCPLALHAHPLPHPHPSPNFTLSCHQ